MFSRVKCGFLCVVILFGNSLSAFLAEPRCYQDLEVNFFREDIVSQALSLHNVAQGGWYAITQQLKERSRDIPKTIHERAARLGRNPLSYPFQAKEAAELLRQVLWEVFYTVIEQSPVISQINPSDIPSMFAYIRQQQAAKLKACFGPEVPEPQPLFLK